MIPMPELNQGNGTTNPNEFITAIFPQNGAPIVQGVLSHDNYTRFETAPGIARVTFSTTTIPPTLTFCTVAKAELQGQDGYLHYFYIWNATTHINMTHLIYPDDCYSETGPNPIDGSQIVKVPEFGPIVFIVSIIAMSFVVALFPYGRFNK